MGVEIVIEPRARDLGGFAVRRALPDARRRSVGPFVFFDHMGPVDLPPGEGMDVRPHPHIGLATVTWLFEGALEHRDSLGSVQVIRPGDVNWMTAGRGIVHSERTPAPERATGGRIHGIQTWVALPAAHEEAEPAFHHHPARTIPALAIDGANYRLIVGTAFGQRSPVASFSPMFYLAVDVPGGLPVALPHEHEERALYVAQGSVLVGPLALRAGQMAVFDGGSTDPIVACEDSRLLLCGGAPLDGPRHVWWNFVSTSRERIERAQADWKAQRFERVPGETEWIPLPGH
jgi:redox-sensitive bicupin YhaK (pirin superfamily)